MREILLLITNYLFFVLMAIFLSGMQSSLWLQIFGYSPAPYLLVIVLNYWTLYRSVDEAVIMHYLVAYVLLTMSGIPLDMAYALVLSVFGVTFLLKSRVLWSGSNSFMLSCSVSAMVVPVSTFLWSQILEDRPLRDFHFYDLIMRILLTSAFSFPFYYFFSWLDRITNKEPPKNTESEVI